MADALGHLSKMGIYDVASWTAVHPGGTADTMHFVSESLTEEYERLERKGLVGKGGKEPSDMGNLIVNGSTVHELDFTNFLPFFKYWFITESSGVYTISDDTMPEYYWIELDKQIERWRFGASKCNKIIIRGPEDGKIMMELEHACRRLQRTATAMTAGALGNMERCLFKKTKFRLADQADAIADGDIMQIESFEFSGDRLLKSDDYASRTAADEGLFMLEPVPGEFREVTLSIVLPRYAATTLQGWKLQNQPLQADITIAGTAGTILIELPELRITEGFGVNIEGPAPLRQEGAFAAYKSSNTYMYTGNEARITVT